jgi:hypothetical protein
MPDWDNNIDWELEDEEPPGKDLCQEQPSIASKRYK